jgi:FKBP-type peptidyl-prolyl cis-trans isomerase
MIKRMTLCFAALFLATAAGAQQPAAASKTPAPAKTAASKSGTAAPTPAKAPAAAPAKAPAKAAAKGPAKAAPGPALTTYEEKFSYALGLSIGQSVKAQAMNVEQERLLRGVRDGVSGATPLLSPQELTEVQNRARAEAATRQEELQRAVAEKNKQEGDAFLEKNKARPGVVTLPSGLQYEVVQEGTGPFPKATDTVTTHYRGTLIDGTEFDSSYKRGQPATFAVGGVIKGWTEALQLMKVGSKWKLCIPAALAYGMQQRGQLITPNSVLLFDLELLAIKEPAAPKN